MVEPKPLLARECEMFPQTEAVIDIKNYKKEVRFASFAEPISNDQMLEKTQITNMTNQGILD